MGEEIREMWKLWKLCGEGGKSGTALSKYCTERATTSRQRLAVLPIIGGDGEDQV